MYEIRRRDIEEKVRENKADKMSTMAEITRLRQMACSCSLVDKKWKLPSSKVLAFIDLAESINESDNRALVFSQFTSFFDEVRRAMDKARLPYLYLDGTTPMAKREQLVRDFQSGNCPFFLITQHTVEEKILRLHKTKRDLADSLLEGADISHAITQEEMLELLKND